MVGVATDYLCGDAFASAVFDEFHSFLVVILGAVCGRTDEVEFLASFEDVGVDLIDAFVAEMDGYAGRFLVLIIKVDNGGQGGFGLLLLSLDDFAAFLGILFDGAGVSRGVDLFFGAVFVLGGEADGDKLFGEGVAVGAFFAELFGDFGGSKGSRGFYEKEVGFGLQVGETSFFEGCDERFVWFHGGIVTDVALIVNVDFDIFWSAFTEVDGCFGISSIDKT